MDIDQARSLVMTPPRPFDARPTGAYRVAAWLSFGAWLALLGIVIWAWWVS